MRDLAAVSAMVRPAAPAGEGSMEAFSDLLLALYRASRERALNEFQDAAIELANSCLNFDSSMWGSATLTSAGLAIHNVHLHNEPPEMVAAYETVRHKDAAMFELWKRRGGTLSFRAATLLSGKDKRDARDHTRRFGHENILLTCDVDAKEQFVQWISLYRADADKRYSGRERLLAQTLRPHLLEALALNRVSHLEHLGGDRRRRRYFLALADQKGMLYHAEAGFTELFQREYPAWRERRLPDALVQGLAGGRHYWGREMVAEAARQAGLLFVKARLRCAADSLSERELQVAREIARGRTYKEVAAALGIAPATARNHLQAIHEKLQVRNKAELIAQLNLSGQGA
jgi:DNA-binding CsgD family transcriptional regulator